MRLTGVTAVLAAAGLALSAAACTPPRPAASPAPGAAARADTAPAPARWTAASSPDSIAAWALSGCRWALISGRIGCYERALLKVLEQAGVEKSMAALDRIVARDSDAHREAHVLAHGIGISAYTTPATVSQTFARCTPAWQSGCYHGVIQAYFADSRTGGATAESLNALCAGYRSPDKAWIQFHCAHGIGHGLMAVNAHHLPKSLAGCELLKEFLERESCYGGAFMENVVNATRPHHVATTQGDAHAHHGAAAAKPPADSAAAGDHHGHHGAQAAAPAEPFKALDRSEPLYPCTIVTEQQQYACYLMQTSAILFNNGGDFGAAARQCERAPEHMRSVCYMSLGRDAAAYSGGDNRKGVRLCQQAPAGRVPWCVIGLAKNRVDVTADAADGFAFCRVVPAGEPKTACYRAVGSQLHVLVATPAARERACTAAEEGFVAACRTGAGLPPEPRPAS